MPITFTGSGAGLFNRFGKFAGGIQDLVALKGGTATARVLSGASMQTRGTDLETYAALSPAVSKSLDGHWTAISSWQKQGPPAFVPLATALLIDQVNQDTPLAVQDLTSALAEVIRQMTASADSINASAITLGAQTALGSPTGTLAIVLSEKRPDGLKWQTLFPEVLRFTCTSDSYTGGATARRETLTCKGAARIADVWDRLWPGGSGGSQTLPLVDAQLDNTSGNNLLYNSDFETFSTSNYPDDWVIASGSAGTHVFSDASNPYTQSNALKLTGSGGTTITLRQSFGTAHSTSAGLGGTPATLLPRTQYAVNLWTKALSAAPAAGVLEVALVDGSNTIIDDDSGVPSSFEIDLTAITTTYAAYSGTFRTPSILPAVYKLQLSTTTAITNGNSIVVDDLAFGSMRNLYGGAESAFGVLGCAFAGDTKPLLGDAWTRQVSNTMGVLAMWLERFFSLSSLGLIVPYDEAAGETILDSVVA